MAANPYTQQLSGFNSGISNARRGLKELYRNRRQAVEQHYNYTGKLYGAAVNTTNRQYGASQAALTGFERGGREYLNESGYAGRQGTNEDARADPELAAKVKAAVDPFRSFLGSEQKATVAWYRGYKEGEKSEDKILKQGLRRELPAALSELEQGIVDVQSNLQTQASAFAQQQAHNAQMQAYMQQSLAFQQQMANGAQGGVGGGGSGRETPNTAQWLNYARQRWGVTVGGWRSKGSVPGSDHPHGRAIDIMSTGALGNAIAADFINNAGARGVKYVIWNRRIWSPGRGWRSYSGPSPHTDHVHVSFLY